MYRGIASCCPDGSGLTRRTWTFRKPLARVIIKDAEEKPKLCRSLPSVTRAIQCCKDEVDLDYGWRALVGRSISSATSQLPLIHASPPSWSPH